MKRKMESKGYPNKAMPAPSVQKHKGTGAVKVVTPSELFRKNNKRVESDINPRGERTGKNAKQPTKQNKLDNQRI